MPIINQGSVWPYLHCPFGPSHEALFPPPFWVVVVHPGLPAVQVLVLPPWVVVGVNPFLFPLVLSASAALGANVNEIADASRRADNFVMAFSP